IADNQLQSQDSFGEENTSSSGKELINGEEWNWRSDIHSSKDGVRPEAHFTLLDSLGKRVRFLRQVQHELKLENIEPVQSRVEEFPSEPPFDGVISRAFASLNDMVSWCHHLPGEQGRFYALKGQMPEDEIALLPEEYQVESVVKLQVPALDGERHLVVIKANKI
ncbi:16S rRNA (guanine(527)-N(7))-methyltransferase RsmG, partial [Escherichia coli]